MTKLTQREFAERAGIPLKTLTNWFEQPKIKIRMDHLFRLAESLRSLGRDANYATSRPPKGRSVWDMIAAGEPIGEEAEEGSVIGVNATRKSPDDIEVVPFSFRDIPILEMSLAAGPWADVAGIDGVAEPGGEPGELFRLRIAGDSMAPRYRNGDIIEFVNIPIEQITPEKDYYVQRADGTATFKRFEKGTAKQLHLRPLNAKKYPNEIVVPKKNIVRIAIARGEFRPFN